MKKKILALSFIGILLSPIAATGVQGAVMYEDNLQKVTQNNESEEVTFTNMDFLKAAELAYEDEYISESDYNFILTKTSQRIGINGVNKIVDLGNNNYELYLNSLVAGTTIGLGGAAAASVTDTSNGIVINYSLIPYTQPNGLISHHTRINSISDQ